MALTFYNPLLVQMTAAQGTDAGVVSATVTRPLRVVDASSYVTVSAGNVATTVKVSGPSADITDAFSLGSSASPGTFGRAATIDDAYTDIMYGSTIQATITGAGQSALVSVTCIDNS
jgi:hypothetical protein